MNNNNTLLILTWCGCGFSWLARKVKLELLPRVNESQQTVLGHGGEYVVFCWDSARCLAARQGGSDVIVVLLPSRSASLLTGGGGGTKGEE